MKKESYRNWFNKVFIRDINLPKSTFIYLFFSLLSIALIAEAFLFKYTISTGGIVLVGVEVYLLLIALAMSFLISGLLIDKIKNRTQYFNIILFICVIGLLISAFPGIILYYSGLLIILITIPQLIITWFTILAHETNILNRGRIIAYLLITSCSISSVSILFIYYESLYIYFSLLELIVFLIILWCSRKYTYIETNERLKSDKHYVKIIFEKHFFRYASSFLILSILLGNILATYGFEVNFYIFGIATFSYLLAAGCALDNIGRKTSIILGIFLLSFFLISYRSFVGSQYIFGLPRIIFLSIHYGLSILPLLLAILTISGDFSTERGNLKFRGRINGSFMSLIFFGVIIGYVFSRWINSIELYTQFPFLKNFLPEDFPLLLNAFILVILLVWMMAMKEFLVSKEKKWANTLKNIFVFSTHGLCLYNHSFDQKNLFKEEADQTDFDEDLISGVLSGVISIISEITHSKKQLRQIKKEEATLLFAYGKHYITALIVSMELPVLFKKLDEFSREFENQFKADLKNFKGNVQRFDPTKFLVIKYFSQKFSDTTA